MCLTVENDMGRQSRPYLHPTSKVSLFLLHFLLLLLVGLDAVNKLFPIGGVRNAGGGGGRGRGERKERGGGAGEEKKEVEEEGKKREGGRRVSEVERGARVGGGQSVSSGERG